MKLQIRPVVFNEASYNVTLLHKILEVLGLPVAATEVEQGRAGEDTRKKVQALRMELNLSAGETTLVDEAMSLAVADALEKKGLTEESRSFTVSGKVRLPNGPVIKRKQVVAFDLDLRGVAVYRNVRNKSEIGKSGGFEFLGQGVSDNQGNHRITFYDWQYGQAERKKADVVVYALQGEEIVGRSRMVNSEDYSGKGMVPDLDVFITREDEKTEYAGLMTELSDFLKESKTTLDVIATSPDQLLFTAGELDVELSRISIAANALLLAKQDEKRLIHELLYGIGRQNIRLSWAVLYKKQEEELHRAITKSVAERIIREFQAEELSAFLRAVRENGMKHMLDDKGGDDKNTLSVMLSNVLPEEKQQLSFLNALAGFKGNDFRKFWDEHLPAQPEFKDNPELVSRLKLTQQLTHMTGNHQTLVKELQVNRKLNSIDDLFGLGKGDWLEIIRKTGVPDFVEGQNDEERVLRYVDEMQGLLNAAFPTRRIARMVDAGELSIDKSGVSRIISAFLKKTSHFDFAASRIHEFDKEIKSAAGKDFVETRDELLKIQRVFQVSTSPEAMSALLKHKLVSAHAIASIPRRSFIKTYAKALGGEETAFAIHQRAGDIAARAELTAMHLMEYSHGPTPVSVMDKPAFTAAFQVLQDQVPNYSNMFSSPDICECGHCRSVYSASAYLVELLRFLRNSAPNSEEHTPYDILVGKRDESGEIVVQGRRPDLAKLLLTCENTNTVIPYIDLANEVMEHYTEKESLTTFDGYNTGEATTEELRANPQHINPEAYRRLKDAKYPFTLPYHQPLDAIRIYSDHLKISRYQAMKAVNPEPDSTAAQAIAAESLRISQEEHRAITGFAFDGAADATAVHEYFGYTASGDLAGMSRVPECLRRSGLAYTELVELLKTRFINPHQEAQGFVERLMTYAPIDAHAFYARLVQIKAGVLDPAADPDISAAINAYNSHHPIPIVAVDFREWVKNHLDKVQQVITLYESDSRCALETTELRTVQSIFEPSDPPSSGLANLHWSRIHRFIRLWRKLGWTIHETDLMLEALGEGDITAGTVAKLESASLLQAATKLPPVQLAVAWGCIDTHGEKCLYKKLFLNKAVQRIDAAFDADASGNYLPDSPEVLANHQSAILAAFRMREEDLAAVLGSARVLDAGNPREIDIHSDKLNLGNLGTIYRYAVLARALKIRITDLCTLMGLFDVSPFSTWDVQQKKFTSIAPDGTYRFWQLVEKVKKSGFKAETLEYILKGTLPAGSSMGLDRAEALQAARAIRDAFSAIEQNHPDTPPSPLTAEILTAKLALTFQPEIVTQFMSILEGTASFQTVSEDAPNITIPDARSGKFVYVKDTGRLSCNGVMSDTEKAELKGLSSSDKFQSAVEELYEAPEYFLSTNLGGVLKSAEAPQDFVSVKFKGMFKKLKEANATLLDHPAQAPAAALEDRLAYVYKRFLPILKEKLRHDALTEHTAALIGFAGEATSLLIARDVDRLVSDLAQQGFSASFFDNTAWTAPRMPQIDHTIDFAWGTGAPHPAVGADNFSARWEAYVAAPASAEYRLRVNVAESDETFKLFLDGELILEKTGAGTTMDTRAIKLNATQMHRLRLDYAEGTGRAGVRLEWLTTATAPEVIPSSVVYPAEVLDAFVALADVYHRAAKFISGFALSTTELNHFIAHSADFGNIDFKALTANHWQRISDYTSLRDAVPQAQALLTDVFVAASRTSPAAELLDLKTLLYGATAWDKAGVDFLVDTHFDLDVADFKNEIALNRMREVMQIVAKTGLSPMTVEKWGAAETDFDALNEAAQLIKNTVKAKYGEEDWLKLTGNLSDLLRKNQQQALVAHLLTRPEIEAWGARDADGLFEYFLIDVQMGACMETSRIVQANASIQMFINRCLLNLETGVSPGAIDKDQWEWMKNYRVWEANRKVFLYPENWLEPEWRNDRSEFFKELESYLVQNDITERSVEQGLRNYLTSLNEVANLDVCGMYQENYEKQAERDPDKLKCLHVFGRTHNTPYQFYYRRWSEYGKWSAWEKVPVDIRTVEDGANSGVHLLPVVWKGRLILFWPEVIEKPEPQRHWEVRLAWSECVDGRWNPKRVSKEFATRASTDSYTAVKDWLFTVSISMPSQELTIRKAETSWNDPRRLFELSDIQSPVEAHDSGLAHNWGVSSKYSYAFSKRDGYSPLELIDDVYLRAPTHHRLLPVDSLAGLDITLDNPFFFTSQRTPARSYFVNPVDTLIIDRLRYPGKHPPAIPGMDGKGRFTPATSPPIGPEDFWPAGGTTRPFSGGVGPYYAAARTMLHSSGIAGEAGAKKSVSTSHGKKKWYFGAAFGGVKGRAFDWGYLRKARGLEFHTFYHPYSSDYVTALNQDGVPGLMESDARLPSDEGATFEDAYDPSELVRKPEDFPKKTYYKENVCFDVHGANSQYNWELFFHAPLYIATRLSKNGQYMEAMKWFHYIFDPTAPNELSGSGESNFSRVWKVPPFKTEPEESLEELLRRLNRETDPSSGQHNPNSEFFAVVSEWRKSPFDPHLVAARRPLAYMKNVVIKYVENLIAWGDSLFRQFERESVNEALQIYVIASHVLGQRPEFVPKRGEIKAESYDSLKDKWDAFSNALVELENIFPYSSEASVSNSSTGSSLLGAGSALYFCIPANDKLIAYWDTVADRLYKIRHCQDIEGVERKLALFSPPIDPGALIQAASQGLSLGSILADLSSPPPIYRFSFLIQKANEFCAEVKALGSTLLATLEKKDGEELSRLRASHETNMLELITAIKDRQVLDARANRENLLKARESAKFRLEHYLDLIDSDLDAPALPQSIGPALTADSQLPADTDMGEIEPDSDFTLVPREQVDIDKSTSSIGWQQTVTVTEGIASALHMIPSAPDGAFGGPNLGAGAQAVARIFALMSASDSFQAAQAAKMAGYERRGQDWTLQANLAAKEIAQLDRQITSADIRIQVAAKELENHRMQIENTKEVELFLKDKFTNQELYQWMKEQLFAVYRESYNLAYDMARKAEKAYRNETGTESASFIQYGYWDNSKQGLVAAEKLQSALRQLEKSYLEENRRELELTRSISLARLNPLALIELRETGKCCFSVPEELFDLDFRGHYFRRFKAVRLSIPCVVGPYTSVSCTLRLLKGSVRINTSLQGPYEHNNEDGLLIDDDRFRTSHVPVTSIATSSAQSDPGLFEFNFRDERYLPFELAGAISQWEVELSTDKELRPFDHSTISDVILHLNYTAREAGGPFKDAATAYIKNFLKNEAGLTDQPLMQVFSMKHEFPTEWHKFLYPGIVGAEQVLIFTVGKERFPFLAQDRNIVVMKVEAFAKCTQAGDYHMILSGVDLSGDPVISSQITMPQSDGYGGLNKGTIHENDPGFDLKQLDIKGNMSVKVKRRTAPDYTRLAAKPDEVEELFLVFHYKLS